MHPQFQHIRVLNSLVGKCLEDGVGVGIQFCMCVRACLLCVDRWRELR